jgi:biotin carboxylase
MNVLFLAPAYPAEMPHYVRGLAEVGARVWGVGDAPVGALSADLRSHMDDYLQVGSLFDEAAATAQIHAWLRGRTVDRIEALWEPLVLMAGRLRDRWGVPGLSEDTVQGFRDKQLMKERVAAAGLRVPHSARVSTVHGAWAAAERIGFPLIVKPIAGAGSADTYRVDDAAGLETVLQATRGVPEVSVEEFVEGEEFTYDTVCVDGRPAWENVAQYLPRPLDSRTHEWISPVIVTVREQDGPHHAGGLALGRQVLGALGMGSGFTHMEWYRKADGEVVFGEIGCRPGGARLVDQMNLTSDIDLYREWARAVCWGSFEADTTRRYNCAIVFKRAQGQGTITRIDGLEAFKQRHQGRICDDTLLRPGQHRRDWKATLVSDGYLLLRDPDWDTAVAAAMDAATNVTLYAGG